MICARKMRTRAEVKVNTRVKDGFGGFDVVVSTAFKIWCYVDDQSGTELQNADRVQTEDKIKVYTRYRSDISTLNFLTIEGRDYNIRRVVDVDRRKRELMIEADGGVRTN